MNFKEIDDLLKSKAYGLINIDENEINETVTNSFKLYLESKNIKVTRINSPIAIAYGKAVNANSLKFRTEKDVEIFANNSAIHSVFLFMVVPVRYMEQSFLEPKLSLIVRMHVVHQNSKLEEYNVNLMNIKTTPVEPIDSDTEAHCDKLLE